MQQLVRLVLRVASALPQAQLRAMCAVYVQRALGLPRVPQAARCASAAALARAQRSRALMLVSRAMPAVLPPAPDLRPVRRAQLAGGSRCPHKRCALHVCQAAFVRQRALASPRTARRVQRENTGQPRLARRAASASLVVTRNTWRRSSANNAPLARRALRVQQPRLLFALTAPLGASVQAAALVAPPRAPSAPRASSVPASARLAQHFVSTAQRGNSRIKRARHIASPAAQAGTVLGVLVPRRMTRIASTAPRVATRKLMA